MAWCLYFAFLRLDVLNLETIDNANVIIINLFSVFSYVRVLIMAGILDDGHFYGQLFVY